jgi:hypothetical protein
MGSSNSSLAEARAGVLVEKALAVLRRENPAGYRRTCATLSELCIRLQLGGDTVDLAAGPEGMTAGATGTPNVRIALSRRTLVALLDGDLEVLQAVRKGAVHVLASQPRLERLARGLRSALHAAVRCPSFPDLLEALREGERMKGGHPMKEVHDKPQRPRPPAPNWGPSSQFSDSEYITAAPGTPRVIVFGGGIAGLTAAHELCVRGYRVVLMERDLEVTKTSRRPRSESGVAEPPMNVGGLAKTETGFIFKDEKGPFLRVLNGVPERIACDIPYDSSGARHEARMQAAIRDLKAYRYQFDKPPTIVLDVYANNEEEAARRGKEVKETIEKEFTDVDLTIDPHVKSAAGDSGIVRFGPAELGATAIIYDSGGKYNEDKLNDVLGAVGRYRARFPGRHLMIHVTVHAQTKKDAEERAEDLAKKVRSHFGTETNAAREDVPNVNAEGEGLPNGSPENTDIARFAVKVFTLPGEHGFRFFPSFYRNLFDTMKRTPLLSGRGQGFKTADEPGHCVFDNLVPTKNLAIRLVPPRSSFTMPRELPGSFKAIRDFVRNLQRSLGFSARDLARMHRKLVQYATSCPKRREEYERLSWFDFIEGSSYGSQLQGYLESSSQALGALLASRSDARTYGNTVVQLLLDQIVVGEHADSTLAGPTSEVWFDHWYKYLEKEGVAFRRGRLAGFDKTASTALLPRIEDPDPDNVIDPPINENDYFVAALSIDQMRKLLDPVEELPWGSLAALPDDLGKLYRFLPAGFDAELKQPTPGGPLKHLSGIQFFFREELRFVDGHVLYPDSKWGLTSISQTPHWYRFHGIWDGFRTVLSIDIGDWASPGAEHRRAWDCTADEIAREVWNQVSAALADNFVGTYDNAEIPKPDYYHLDRNIEFGSRTDRILPIADHTPFLVNTVGSYADRPGKPGDYQLWGGPSGAARWVLAGNYMQTYTRLTTMEAPNESARHAVNAILKATAYRGDRCPVYDPEEREPDDLKWFRDLDQYLCDRGAPHWLDVDGGARLLENLLPAGSSALQELLTALE